ncbi:transposase [Streptomyces sp. NPDC053541]|uniref:IS701 family transposase n=1 Tax=Streptomyces sp. NPDC053541 TaxID=3365709 RepID=UPI0037D39C03
MVTVSSIGMRAAERESESERMRAFLDEVFQPLHRAEQRRWAREYLWGLIHLPGRKTPRSMARAGALPAGAAHGLHQFVNASPWSWGAVRTRLARVVAESGPAYAWTVADVIIPKQGEHSVGVHRRVDPETGRTVNCQRGVGLFLMAGTRCFPVDWRLVLRGAWDWDEPRRRRARIPEAETGRPVGAFVLEYAAAVAVARPRLPDVPWVLDLTRRCDDAGGVMAGLARRGLDFLCEVDAGQTVLAGRRSPAVTTVGELMEEPHARQPHVLPGPLRRTAARPVRVNVSARTVRLSQRGGGRDGASAAYHVLELPPGDSGQAARYWVTNVLDRGVEELLALARTRAAAGATVEELRRSFGVLDFEGRSYTGWHHHMTMASAAYAYQHLYGAAARPADTEVKGLGT